MIVTSDFDKYIERTPIKGTFDMVCLLLSVFCIYSQYTSSTYFIPRFANISLYLRG